MGAGLLRVGWHRNRQLRRGPTSVGGPSGPTRAHKWGISVISSGELPVISDTNMRRLAADHRRMLGNGMCTRPVALDCSFESACERCNFFETGPQFIPILRRQRDHATEHGQEDRIVLFDRLIKDVDGEP